MAVCFCGAIVLDCLVPSLSRVPLVSLMLKFFCSRLISVRVRSVLTRVPRLSPRPIVLPAVLPTVPRASVFDWRARAAFPAAIVRPIRVVDPVSVERWLVADRSLVIETDCSFPPIKLPMLRLRSVRDVERLRVSGLVTRVSGLVEPRATAERRPEGRAGERPLSRFELTAGCCACLEAEESRVPIILPIRERRLVLDSFVTFERDDRLLE